jgi:phage antirepressor YoqD-like protein
MANIDEIRATDGFYFSEIQESGVITVEDFCMIEKVPQKWLMQLLINEGYAYRLPPNTIYLRKEYTCRPTRYFNSKLTGPANGDLNLQAQLTAIGMAKFHKLCKRYRPCGKPVSILTEQ